MLIAFFYTIIVTFSLSWPARLRIHGSSTLLVKQFGTIKILTLFTTFTQSMVNIKALQPYKKTHLYFNLFILKHCCHTSTKQLHKLCLALVYAVLLRYKICSVNAFKLGPMEHALIG